MLSMSGFQPDNSDENTFASFIYSFKRQCSKDISKKNLERIGRCRKKVVQIICTSVY